MKKLIIVLFSILFTTLSINLLSQTIYPKKIIRPLHFDLSEKLSEVEPIPPGIRERSWKNSIIKNFDNFMDDFENEGKFDKSKLKIQNNYDDLATPQVIQNFPGVPNLSGVAPPDTDGDVGPNHYFQMINLAFSIWDKEGNQLMAPADNQTLWEGFDDGQPFDNANDGDPIVLYDEYSDRWIATQFALSTNNGKYYELIAVSTTPDPLGSWYRYAYEFDNLNDYPKFGIWNDAYYFSINQFDNWQWAGGGICAVDKAKMLVGDPTAEMVFFDMGTSYGSLLPADADGATPPPSGSPEYFMSMGSNNLKIWEVDIDWETPENSTTNYLSPLVTEQFYTNNINIVQKGTSKKLDALSGRLMYRLQYRNFGDYEVMLTNHTVRVDDNGRAGVKWYELRKYPGGAWYIYQQGTYAPDDGNSRWMASVAMNDNGDIAIGYSVSGPLTYPSIRFAGQLAGAAMGLGVLDVEETSILTGNKSQANLSRWGDYSCMSVDPSDGTTFWFTTEWTNGGWSWKTQIASLDFTQVPETDFTADEEIIPTGETVNFTDQTNGNPTSWEWTFEGGEPGSSTEQDPTAIVYDTEGVYNVSLTTQNTAGDNTMTKTGFITVSSTILPLVDFDVDNKFGCLADTVRFFDKSLYSPIAWQWEISPGTFHFIEGTDANSQNAILIFDEVDTYSISLTTSNLNGSSSLTKDNEVMAGGFVPYFSETFENDGLKTNYWQIQNPDDEISWDIYNVGGNEPGFNAAGIKLDEYFPVGDRDRLVSPPFNLKGMNNAVMEFEHAYAKRNDKARDSLIVLVSGDCGNTWTRVFANGEDGSGNFATAVQNPDFWPVSSLDWCIAGWGAQCINIDLNPWLNQAEVRIAFESYNDYGNPIFIDNVSVSQYVGVNNVKADDEFVVYPNPSKRKFHILLSENHLFNKLSVISFQGDLIYQQGIAPQISVVDIDLGSTLSSGVYYLRLNGNAVSASEKLIILK
ncbi:MAG: PKD domain-containing protein [Chlorobi bacterium]|nr:PKD domain-containing protein [Chlorobiota bacterium]